MASHLTDAAWLEWISSLMGAGPRQTLTAALPQEQFQCLLDELPLHLVPQRHFHSQPDQQALNQPLFLNQNCSLLQFGDLPQELDSLQPMIQHFNLQGTVAWVRDPVTGLQPFCLGSRLSEVVSNLHPNEAAPASLPRDARWLLAQAAILVPERYAERRLAQWAEVVKNSAAAFREKGYAPLSGVIHRFQIAALRRYYRCAIRLGRIRLGDHQSPRRYVAYNHSVARFFHHQLANAVSAVVGETVKPSYVYLASYLSGAELKKHTDRPQCEFSVTLCLDYSPEPALATPWPIRLDTPDGSAAIYQALGDALVYRGTKVPHYRHVLAEGHSSTSIFFHYVPQGFPESLE